MSEPKWTPGPWKVIAGPSSFHALRGETQKQAEANAHLIAAAPELYDAIELILPLARGYRPEGQTYEARQTCRSWIEAAENALAKARGEHDG